MANNLSVRGPFTHNDTDIATAVANALEANVVIPDTRLDVTVQNGKVTLRGGLDWSYQATAAVASIRALKGVRDVINLIQVT